jgi:domain of unknown function (DUF1704)
MEKFENKNLTENIKTEFEKIYEDVNEGVLSMMKPKNKTKAKEEFLANSDLGRPDFDYSYNEEFFIKKIDNFSKALKLLESDEFSEKEKIINRKRLERASKRVEFVEKIFEIQNFDNTKKQLATERFNELNHEIWGDIDRATYLDLMGDQLSRINSDRLDEKGLEIYNEFKQMLHLDYSQSLEKRFQPKQETIEFVRDAAKIFYGDLLEDVAEMPEGDYSQQDVFNEISKVVDKLKDRGFNNDWQVVWDNKNSAISVSSIDKKVNIPVEGKKRKNREALQGVIAHEIGVHLLRSEIGSQMPDKNFELGADGYLDSEEGIARVLEMAISGEYVEAGIPYYLTTGLAEFEGKNFREAFEVNWRMILLTKNKSDFSDEAIEKAKSVAYNRCFRIFRADDNLAWRKDLSYYNGANKIWKYIEENRDSETLFDDLFLGGRADLFNKEQQREIYEMKTTGRQRIFDENGKEII